MRKIALAAAASLLGLSLAQTALPGSPPVIPPRNVPRNVAYFPAVGLKFVGGTVVRQRNGSYLLKVGGRSMLVRVGQRLALSGSSPTSTSPAPYLSEGSLYIPVSVLRVFGCSLDTSKMPNLIVSYCGDKGVEIEKPQIW